MQHATSWFETAGGPSLALMAMVRRAGGSDFTGPSIRLVLSYLARAGNARWRVLVSVLSQLIERGRRWEIAQSRSFDLYGSHMQYQSLDMEHSFICPMRGVQRPEAVVHAYPKMRCLTVASGAISRPSLVVHKIRGPTWRKDYPSD